MFSFVYVVNSTFLEMHIIYIHLIVFEHNGMLVISFILLFIQGREWRVKYTWYYFLHVMKSSSAVEWKMIDVQWVTMQSAELALLLAIYWEAQRYR